MRKVYRLEGGRLSDAEAGVGNISVYANPTPAERAELLSSLKIDEYTLESALDPDEISRVEVEHSQTFIIWKRPNSFSFHSKQLFEVSSVGIFLLSDRVTFVLGDETSPFGDKSIAASKSLNDLVLRFLLHTVRHYLGHLKAIKLISREIQDRLNSSMSNDHLLKMFSLSESLIYYQNAIEANAGALMRLTGLAEKLGFSKEEISLLDDLTIENTQCGRQAEIYGQVLSGLMDARGNIINNNMNILLKNLTLISVVFLPVSLVAGIGGMSEFTMMTEGVPWWISYPLLMLGLSGLALLTWLFLKRRLGRMGPHN